ncbi:MAG TPA: helix-turn-helix domain-containing protein [Aggregatilineaceae bacterium]|nr:helix-turn-helix domain-containing protein [Aggregatilineaceae bacterium]
MGHTSEWVSLGEAAEIIGVHPATIRNWAERGELPFRRTPGGHRRFRRVDLKQWLASHRLTYPSEAQVVVQTALGRTRLEIGDKQKLYNQDWYEQLSVEAREIMRQQGLYLMDILMQHLANPGQSEALHAAATVGETYGKLLKSQGLVLSKALEGYFYFSDFLLDAVIQLSDAGVPRSTTDWGGLLRQVQQFTRAILTTMIAVYEAE